MVGGASALVLLSLIGAQCQGFGGRFGQWSDGDVEKWSEVSDMLASAPPQKLVVEWSDRLKVEPNMTVGTGRMMDRPRLVWPAERGALYTAMILDISIERILPKSFIHWMVVNIPGNRVNEGNEVMDYVPPFHFELNEEGSFIKDIEESGRPMLVLVFKQTERIWMEETHAGCNKELVTDRFFDFRELAKKYGWELVAGNFMRVPWSGFFTEQMMCRTSRCVGEPWPIPLPGVNDLEDCQAREEIMDISIAAPVLAQRKLYAYWHSPLSMNSILSSVRNLYPTYSTGRFEDFSAISGSYDAPYLTENQAQTQEGVFDATFTAYPNAEKARELFLNVPTLIPTIVEAITSGAYTDNTLYKIVLAQPDDQDWNFSTVLERPGMVMEMFLVKTKEGQREQHHEARKEFIALTRNVNDVIGAYTFEVDQDIMKPTDPFYFDSSNNDIMIVVYPSAAARARAQGEMYTHAPEVFGRLSSTFTCIMCAVLEKNYHPSFYGPFP